MNKLKAIFKGEHRGFAWFCVVAVAAFLFAWTFGPGNTFIHWFRAKREIAAQEEMMEQYNREIEDMEQRYNDLNSNRDSLGKFAVERFGFTEPGEDLYILDK